MLAKEKRRERMAPSRRSTIAVTVLCRRAFSRVLLVLVQHHRRSSEPLALGHKKAPPKRKCFARRMEAGGILIQRALEARRKARRRGGSGPHNLSLSFLDDAPCYLTSLKAWQRSSSLLTCNAKREAFDACQSQRKVTMERILRITSGLAKLPPAPTSTSTNIRHDLTRPATTTTTTL